MPNEIYIPFRGRKIKFGSNLACKILFKSSRYIPFEMDAKKKLARTSMEVGTLTPTGSVITNSVRFSVNSDLRRRWIALNRF